MVESVLAGTAKYAVVQADAIAFLRGLPADSCDLIFGSPPYSDCRSYGIDFSLKGQQWVDWMVEVYQASLHACRGLVAFVIGHGKTEGYRWDCTPAFLCADLHRAGICLRSPKWYHRVGICGSGGPDDFRRDVEWVVCATRGGRLPWSENTACGHPPKYKEGGLMSHHDRNGRVNSRSHSERKSYRKGNGRMIGVPMPDGTIQQQSYIPPEIANPGDLIRCNAGGGHMGSRLAHANEASFPEQLAERFIRSFCPPGGLVCDPFAGSGTTLAVSLAWGRRALGCDIRESQVRLTEKRISSVTPTLFPEGSS